ncbi:16S rRNA (cytidine(1402)-2'-O)-methyltransferase [candidate division WWE3 bacterium CG_4_10_14_0_2_um_filter_42_7]|uniref:Ribosomal RNA small subunit methyltransferase I n=2 Tax=Katanobacteria TaxID=422282 RepID=A0A2H0X9H8_UNCKA|nr:MAG: 16S rRNA (cytidine(1402)-2'-O)-methyltransferase [candidate division WWE3 bacterium CG08_land_8_20_14_0_20_41_15]PIZ43729.1 MAG: 16S rRNA (cytidine(1402)-2'-O)-methyltransferase [candidate division WWE3 bacterium CG_4_10_14_0_2_um_filter_42_7]
MGNLYLIATPIGNLGDITLRALETLKKVDLVLCEDTRKTGFLLNHYQISKPLLSYFEHNELKRIPEVLTMLEKGKEIALVSDAGTPLISDPGFKLVRETLQAGANVIPIPGPSSVLAALISSGFPTDKFLFLGYLPRTSGKKEKVIREVPKETSVIFFESPFRIINSLEMIYKVYGDIEIFIGRELTKVYEEKSRGTALSLIEKFKKSKPRGEFVAIFNISKELPENQGQ